MQTPEYLFSGHLGWTEFFLVRTRAPRFIARLTDEDSDEGAILLNGGGYLHVVDWIDPERPVDELTALLPGIDEAIEAQLR